MIKSNKSKNLRRRFTVNLAPNYEKKGFQDGLGWAQHYHKQKSGKDTQTPKGGANAKYTKIHATFNPDLLKIKSMKSDISYEHSSMTS